VNKKIAKYYVILYNEKEAFRFLKINLFIPGGRGKTCIVI